MKALCRCVGVGVALTLVWCLIHVRGEKGSVSERRRVGGCNMDTCFEWSRCENELKVFVYDDAMRREGVESARSETYNKMIQSLRESAFYTKNASEACLFVLSIDTTDRDKMSDNYVRDVQSLMDELPQEVWNGGMNHVVFVTYHGTYPDYADESLGFNTQAAIVARASAAGQKFRDGFDVSLPLFHKEHPMRDVLEERRESSRGSHPMLVSFKGKRYVYGIGSETRDSLHFLHDPRRSPMLTTCRHNNDWREHQDERCSADNDEYDKWDYEALMHNSTFCLTPRGRRLGSFRFLEALHAGCIPVVLSDDWRLPFDEVIDWSQAAVSIPERNVLLVNDIVASIPRHRVKKMSERGRAIYHRYFSTVERITLNTMQIIWKRVQQKMKGLSQSETTTNDLLPFTPEWKNTAARPLITVVSASERTTTRLQRTIEDIAPLHGLHKVIVVWPSARGSPPIGADFGLKHNISVHIHVVEKEASLPLVTICEEYFAHERDSVVLFISDSTTISSQELSRMLHIFEKYPYTIVSTRGIDYSPSGVSSSSSLYSAALLETSFVHSGYVRLLSSFLPSSLLSACPTASLSTLVSISSLSPPTVVALGRVLPPVSVDSVTKCLNLISSRYPMGAPLLSSYAYSAVDGNRSRT